MRSRLVSITAAVLAGIAAGAVFTALAAQSRDRTTPVTWQGVAPLHRALEARGMTSTAFPAYVERVRQANVRRVGEGDLDHLVFYLLQSTRFTALPPIEPALSAKRLVDTLEEKERAAFLRTGEAAASRVPADVRARVAQLLRALGSPSSDPRLVYFRELVTTTFADSRQRDTGLIREYFRAMRFIYEKEFVAQRSARAPEAVAELYRTRGLSTDTAVEAGYLVYIGLGVVKSLEPDRRIRRVLIIGPGLDLAPRTALLEAGPPESYQPWAVMDALLSLGLSRAGDVEVVAADINPRVVSHLRRSRAEPPALMLVSEIRETETVTLSADYRDYFANLGQAVGEPDARPRPSMVNGHAQKTVRVSHLAAHALRGETLDVVTGHLRGAPFDLVVATNILPYFDDVQLILAMSNISTMLTPGGLFLHNEARPLMHDVTTALGLPFEQSRHAIIANVRGAPAPLGDSVWLHRKARK